MGITPTPIPTPEQLANVRAQAEPTYTIVVNARQVHYMKLAMRMFIENDPGEELDDSGQDIPTVLEELLSDPNLFPSPDINSFVV